MCQENGNVFKIGDKQLFNVHLNKPALQQHLDIVEKYSQD